MRLILDAIAAVRQEVKELREEVGEKVQEIRQEHAEDRKASKANADAMNARVTLLERFRWQVAGALTAAGALAGYLLR